VAGSRVQEAGEDQGGDGGLGRQDRNRLKNMHMWGEIKKLNDQGLVSVRKNPYYDIWIINYTAKAQYEFKSPSDWPESVKKCRGLIIDSDGDIIARPFEKFFNIEEHSPGEIPSESYTVWDKLDGSLGICYYYNESWQIATRGSFESDQAAEANKMLKYYDTSILMPGYTYMLEIIYPENRIVVNYGDDRKLVMLGAIHNNNGHELHPEATGWPHIAERVRTDSWDPRLTEDWNNKEGFVFRYKFGMRVKLKYKKYVELHRLVAGLTEKRVWEHLNNGDDFMLIIKGVPDELLSKLMAMYFALKEAYAVIEHVCLMDMNEWYSSHIDKPFTRKDFAIWAKDSQYSSILFAMYGNKPYSQIIWSIVKSNINTL